jgi:Neuraminidase (sialidase)
MKRLCAVLALSLAACRTADVPFYNAQPIERTEFGTAPAFISDPNVVVLATEFPAVETSIAISPLNANNAVVASMGYHTPLPYSDAHFTRDGGRTWTRRTLALTGTNGVTYQWHSDPAVGADANGTFYYGTMLIKRNEQNRIAISMAVSRSDDGGDTWTTPVNVTETDGITVMDDKNWLAVDDTTGIHAGNVYKMWGRYYLNPDGTSQNGEILFARSTDRGETWTIAPLTGKVRVGMSLLTVGPNGEVYAAYNDNGIKLRVSKDGGQTFSPATPIPVQFGPGGTIPNTRALFSPMPTFAADRSFTASRGTLYYFSPTRGTTRQDNSVASTVGLWISRDGGTTWENRRVFSTVSSSNDAVFPMVAVDQKTGEVVVSWLDRRDDPLNIFFRVYASRSQDGGRTWDEPRAFTSPFDLDRSFLGHYLWNAAHDGNWMATFTDGAGTMSVAHLDFGQRQPDPPHEPRRKRRAVR